MGYKLRPGVELIKVCGAHLLIPSHAASEHCDGLYRLSTMETIYIQQLTKGKTMEELSRILGKLARRESEEMRRDIEKKLATLVGLGFLIEVDEP